MKLLNLTILVALILTACPTVRCYGFIETVFDNLQTQSTITRNVATRAEQENAKKRAVVLLQRQASLSKHRFIMVKTASEDEVSAPAEHHKSTYVIYDTQTHTTADKYAYSNITAPKGSTVAVGGVDVCIAE